MAFRMGQYVRSRGGYPARALGIEHFCLRKTSAGTLLLDTIRQNDVTVLPSQVPTMEQLQAFLESHRKAHQTAQESPEKPAGQSKGTRDVPAEETQQTSAEEM